MVEIEVTDLAIIFEPRRGDEGVTVFIPTQVVEGYYDDNSNRFVDKNLYSYAHLTDCELSKGYALRNPINELSLNYPDKSLEEIKKILLESYSQYKYFLGFHEGEIFIFRYEENREDAIAVIDEDTKTNIMLLLNDEEINKLMFTKLKDLNNVEDNEDDEYLEEEAEIKDKNIKFNPHLLYKQIKEIVKGQDNAIKEIVTTIWENYNSDRANNLILVGSSGTGKTEILRQISKRLDIPLLITAVTGMSQAGYVGTGTDEILKNLLSLTKGDVEKAEHAIIVLDEIDKLSYRNSDSGSISTEGVQNELLKIVEDGTFYIDFSKNGMQAREKINTANITFVGVGAFNGMLTEVINKQMGFGNDITTREIAKEKIVPEDLIKYGLKPELVGRMGKIVKLNDLSLEDMKDIIKNSKVSAYTSKINFLKKQGIKIDISLEDEIIEEIDKIAISKKIGARSITGIVNEMFTDILFDISDPDERYKELEISKETVTNSKKYVLRK